MRLREHLYRVQRRARTPSGGRDSEAGEMTNGEALMLYWYLLILMGVVAVAVIEVVKRRKL
jgi:hypothetical protein